MRLELDAVGHHFRNGPWLFQEVSADFEAGTVTAITGPSGSGKSTLLRIIARRLQQVAGEVRRVRIESLAVVPQVPIGVGPRTGLDHLVLPLLAEGLDRPEAEDFARPVGELFGLSDRLGAPFRELSVGEAQRLMLARAVVQKADLILADEPTASLDVRNAIAVVDVLGNLSKAGAVVVVATHDARVRDACDQVIDLGASMPQSEM
jgi:ABC-type lipoprotein export system ATPase subunit